MFLTVITPTTGKDSLDRLIASIDSQSKGRLAHLLLWDDRRDRSIDPASFNSSHRFSVVCPPGTGRNGDAPGSILRSVGMMLARSPWVTFADDDVWWEPHHVDSIEQHARSANWLTVLRTIHSPRDGSRLGVDRFESVGDDPSRKVPYEMCDGNTMSFKREFGVAAAHMFRETTDYNDDRLLYEFLKQFAGPRQAIRSPSINQVCPDRLHDFFARFCTQD